MYECGACDLVGAHVTLSRELSCSNVVSEGVHWSIISVLCARAAGSYTGRENASVERASDAPTRDGPPRPRGREILKQAPDIRPPIRVRNLDNMLHGLYTEW